MTTIDTQSALDAKIKMVCDVLRRSNCAGPLQYVPELTWLLFLRFLDERETLEQRDAEILGIPFRPSLDDPYRWRSWAAREGDHRATLQNGSSGDVFRFLEGDLLPHLQTVGGTRDAGPRQRLISQIVADVNKTRVNAERDFLDVIDRVDDIRLGEIDDQHMFALSAAYEGLLLSMREGATAGGQFYTPREVVRAMVRVADPKVGDMVYDPCCGTGGFLAQAYEYMRESLGSEPSAKALQTLAEDSFFGREKDNLAYPIALANLVLHGIDFPHIWHGNTLTDNPDYAQLFDGFAPPRFEVILTNPPFGGDEGPDAQTNFSYQTSTTQVLFLQHVIDSLAADGRAAMVIDEGLLFRTSENAFVQTKQKLLGECDLYCVVSLPDGAFARAGGGVKTNLLFFDKGKQTEQIWYYELRPYGNRPITKVERPLTLDHFAEFFELLPSRADSESSWTVTIDEIKERNYDLKAVNPHRVEEVDTRTPSELLAEIEQHNAELNKALSALRKALKQ